MLPQVLSRYSIRTVRTVVVFVNHVLYNYSTLWGGEGGTALQPGRSWVRFPMVSLEFFIHIILPAALRPWGRLSL
jgi:hypothetical protein